MVQDCYLNPVSGRIICVSKLTTIKKRADKASKDTKASSHYSDVIISAMAYQITDVLIVCSTVCSGADQTKHEPSASLAFVRGNHWWPLYSPHKGPVMRKMFSFGDDMKHNKHIVRSRLPMITFLITDTIAAADILCVLVLFTHSLMINTLVVLCYKFKQTFYQSRNVGW